MKSFADSAPRILVADDQADVLEALRLLLKGEGYQMESVASPAAAVSTLEARDFDVVLIDLNYTRDTTSGQEGLDLLSRIQAIDSILPVIVMTAWGTVGLAVEAMRRGARDFIQKPWENERLLSIVKTQIDLSNAIRRGMRLEAENRLLRAEGVPSLIAESPSMQPVLQMISRVGPSDANVLITGEPGTGKEVVAKTLFAISPRATKPMVTVNAGGLAEGVFESELFGHVKGAFTDAKADRVGRFELADGGTLFLDEIANVPMNLQAKMLRVLEVGEMERVGSSKTKRVDVRVISTEHHRDSPAAIARTSRGCSTAGRAFSFHSRTALSQAHQRFRSRVHAVAARQSVAGQCARIESCHRTSRAHGAGEPDQAGRSGAAFRARRQPAFGRYEHRRSGGFSD
jgi:DNA-binding NtrC family response regulator